MQPQHRRFLDSLDYDGWHGNDRPVVDGEGKDIDEMLDELNRRVSGRLREFKNNQEFTPPSRERREARQRAEYHIQQADDHAPVSGTA